MENCSLKTLKADVINDKLSLFNCLVIDLKPGTLNLFLKLKAGSKLVFDNLTDSFYVDGNAISSGYVVTAAEIQLTATITVDTKLQLGNMYDCTSINEGSSHNAEMHFKNLASELMYGSLTILNIAHGTSDEDLVVSEIKNPSAFTKFSCNTGMFTGSLSGFSSFIVSTWIKVAGSEGLTGEITAFIPCKALTQLILTGCSNITAGTYESLVAGQCNAQSGSAARTSGTMYVYSDKHTFNGVQRSDVMVVFSATGAVVKTGAGVTLGTYTTSSNTWSYA